jgi:dihydrofolate reductase
MGGSGLKLALIVAVAENGVIGNAGKLPWRLRSDLKRFRQLTLGHPLIMGRRTFESIGKPLDGRDSIVISRSMGKDNVGGLHVMKTLDEALDVAARCAEERNVDWAFVIGGAALFDLALPIVSRIYLTRVHASPDGDTRWAPELAHGQWRETECIKRPASPEDDYAVTDLVLDRIAGM